ncbi:porin OmpL1 [Leptospira ainazelensis]|uniref:porin OmpL1 n=1 Tax=Leptospira ainazelensis TaxID=2810034 RepID=UPI001E5F7C5B|nr:porin OmpL1 [Leptospira ainazelensis]
MVIPENRLQTLKNTTAGMINVKHYGAMSGLVFSAGYGCDLGKDFFIRIAANYMRKVMGGDTEAKALGFRFYDIFWDYNAVQIPINFGIKASVWKIHPFISAAVFIASKVDGVYQVQTIPEHYTMDW